MAATRGHQYVVPALPAAAALLVAGLLLLFAGLGRHENLLASIKKDVYSYRSDRGLQPWCPVKKPTKGAAANEIHSLTFPITPFPSNFWFVSTVGTSASILSSVFHTVCLNYGVIWLQPDITRLEVGTQQPRVDALQQVQQRLQNLTDVPFNAITSPMVYNKGIADQLQPKFLFTVVKHPVDRVQSHYVEAACVAAAELKGWNEQLPHRHNQDIGPGACDVAPEFMRFALQNDTVKARWAFARSTGAIDNVFHYIRGNKATVQDAAAQYDFIFTAERINEGLVLFMLKYGLTLEDIAYLPVMVQPTTNTTVPEIPKGLADFILNTNKKDMLLWEIANSRLDRERAELQRNCAANVVDRALEAFQSLLSEIKNECADYQVWYRQHGFDGPYTYTGIAGVAFDSGHGNRCVRHVARRFQHSGPIAAARPGGVAGTFFGVRSHSKSACVRRANSANMTM